MSYLGSYLALLLLLFRSCKFYVRSELLRYSPRRTRSAHARHMASASRPSAPFALFAHCSVRFSLDFSSMVRSSVYCRRACRASLLSARRDCTLPSCSDRTRVHASESGAASDRGGRTAARISREMEENNEVSEAQWEEAKRLFNEALQNGDNGTVMSDEEASNIATLLANWDELSHAERADRGAGNQHYSRKKYAVVAEEGGGQILCLKGKEEELPKRVCRASTAFDDIKRVHRESEAAVFYLYQCCKLSVK
eukprot:6176204-Pleurochrysis_carterae.AAC.2